MRLPACSREKAVWRAVATGVWEPELRNHAEACMACGEVALITGALAKLDPATAPLPDAKQIWWRARWLRTQEAERAARPVLLFQRFALAGLILGAVLTPVLFWTALPQWLPVPRGQWSLFGLALPGLVIVSAVIALAGLGALLLLRAALAEE